MSFAIQNVHARQILDSRGNPTVEVDVTLEMGVLGRAAVPSGASTGEHEACELRDEDKALYMGKSMGKAVHHVNHEIRAALLGKDGREQELIDESLNRLDGTPTKHASGPTPSWGCRWPWQRRRRKPPACLSTGIWAERRPRPCRAR